VADIAVREATSGEYAAIDDLVVEVYVGEGWLAADEAEGLRGAASRAEGATIFVAVDAGGAIVGTVTVVTAGERERRISTQGEGEVRLLVVSPAARGRGAGLALTQACIERARIAGCARVVLATLPAMTDAQRVYERLGFVRVASRDAAGPSGAPMWVYGLGVGERSEE
jgi:ribosomal protein S18 acetylase RimI-like enzyme